MIRKTKEDLEEAIAFLQKQLDDGDYIKPWVSERTLVKNGPELQANYRFTSESTRDTSRRYLYLVEKIKDHIMAAWNTYGETPIWSGQKAQNKAVIKLNDGHVIVDTATRVFHPIHLPTIRYTNKFREAFAEEEIKLFLTMGVW